MKHQTALERFSKLTYEERQKWMIGKIEEAIKEVGEDMAPFYLLGVLEATLGVDVKIGDYVRH